MKNRLTAIDGLKFLAVLLIYWWHCPLPKPEAELGGRMCAFLFLASGFLVARTYRERMDMPLLRKWWRYALYKFLAVWPLHFLMFLVCAWYWEAGQFSSTPGWRIALANLLLLQAWVPDPAWFFSFNGVSWFLSVLMFCYLLSFPVLTLCKRTGPAFVAFAACVFLSWTVERAILSGVCLPLDLHVSPLVRSLQFFTGMSAYCVISGSPRRPVRRKWSRSVLEVVALSACAGMVFAMRSCPMAVFCLFFAFILVVFMPGDGCVSRLLSSRPLRFASSWQFEFFMIHQVVIRVFSHYCHDWIRVHLHAGHHAVCIAYISGEFILCCLLAWGWHRFVDGYVRRLARTVFPAVGK